MPFQGVVDELTDLLRHLFSRGREGKARFPRWYLSGDVHHEHIGVPGEVSGELSEAIEAIEDVSCGGDGMSSFGGNLNFPQGESTHLVYTYGSRSAVQVIRVEEIRP